MRKKSKVSYGFSDIMPTGEFRGKYNTYGVSVYFKTEEGETLVWKTTTPPSRYNSVEKYAGGTVEISYDVVLKNEETPIKEIEKVKFIHPKK